MIDLILVGGGGHCKSVIEVIESTGMYNIVGILDKKENVGSSILGYEIIGCDDDIPALAQKVQHFVITVGQIKSSQIRQKIYQNLKAQSLSLPTIIASTAWVSDHATLGEGTVIHHHAFVNADTRIGICGIVNSGSIIEHDTTVGDFCHISTNATINGTCTIGVATFIGSGSVINNNLTIGSNSVVASGTLVRKCIQDGSLIYSKAGVLIDGE